MSHPVIQRPGLPVPLPLSRGGTAATTAGAARTALGLGTVAIEDYEEGSYTATGLGFSGTAPSAPAYYARLGALFLLTIPRLEGTSNSTGMTITGLPTAFQVPAEMAIIARVTDNGVTTFGYLLFLPGDSNIYIGTSPSGAQFTASGAKGMLGVSLSYLLL